MLPIVGRIAKHRCFICFGVRGSWWRVVFRGVVVSCRVLSDRSGQDGTLPRSASFYKSTKHKQKQAQSINMLIESTPPPEASNRLHADSFVAN